MSIRTDYQTVLEIDTATPIAAGQMRADGGDVRVFGDAAHSEALDFYIDPTTLNTTATRIHIKQDLPTGRYHPGIAFYAPLDGTSGSEPDIVGGASGTVTGGTRGVAGQIGNCIEFSDTSTHGISYPAGTISVFNSGKISIECWVNVDAISSVPRFVVTSNAGETVGFRFQALSGGSGWVPYIEIRRASTAAVGHGSVDIPFGNWAHCVATWEEDELVTLYINGAETSYTGRTLGSGVIENDSGENLIIGNNVGGNNNLDGKIDNVAIYERVLTADEVRSSYLRGRAGKRLQEPTPTAYWTFNSSDNAGSEVVDLVGGNNGTITGGVTVGQPGKVGQAFGFDGATSYISVPDNTLFEPHVGVSGTSTWAATINPTTSAVTVVSKRGAGGSEFEALFSNGIPALFLSDLGGTNWMTVQSDVPVPLDTTSHVTWVYDQAAGAGAAKVRIYIDGVNVPVAIGSSGGTFVSMASGTAAVTIGADDFPANYFEGTISEVLWSNSVLTDIQITELARRSEEGLRLDLTNTSLDLLAYWSLDNRDIGIDPQDTIGSNHGTVTGAVLVGQESLTGQSFEFGVNDSYVGVPDSTDFDAHTGGSGVCTVGAWIYHTANANETIFSKYNNTSGGREFIFGIQSDDTLFFEADEESSGDYIQLETVAGIPLNTWTHVAYRFDMSQGHGINLADLFINGVLAPKVILSQSGTVTTIEAGTADVIVGANIGAASAVNGEFNGRISEVMYFGELLTNEQIRDLYEKGVADAGALSDTKRVYVTYGDTTKTSASSAANTFVREITGLVHAYQFDETTGSTVTDASGSDDGTVVGGVLVENAVTGLARNTNQEGVIDFTTQNIPTGDASVVTRFRTTTSDQVLWSNYDGDSDNAGLALEITSSGYLQARHSTGAGSDNALATGATAIDDGVLHTAIVVKSDADISIFLDGYNLEATDAMTSVDVTPAANYRAGGYKEVPFTPPTGLVLSFEADQINTSTDLDADGRVSNWPDNSSSGNDASQVTASIRPIYRPNGIGGRPSVYFDADHILPLDSELSLANSNFTLFTVFKFLEEVDETYSIRVLAGGSDTARSNLTLGNFTGDFTNETIAFSTTPDNTNNYGVSANSITLDIDPYVLMVSLNGTTETINLRSVSQSLTAATPNGGLDSSGGTGLIFDAIGHPSVSLLGDLSCLMIFDNDLSAADKAYVERYLTLKYGSPNTAITGATRASASYDEIRVFDKVLNQNEITDLMDNYGEPVGSRVQVRKRNDPEPVLNTSL